MNRLFTPLAALVLAIGVSAQPVEVPENYNLTTTGLIEAEGFDSHVDLRWKPIAGAVSYRVLRNNLPVGETRGTCFMEFLPTELQNTLQIYKVIGLSAKGRPVGQTPDISISTRRLDDEELLEMIQRYTFRYFWDYADPLSGMARERNSDPRANNVTVGGSGFGVMALIVGAERGFAQREAVAERLLKILNFLEKAPRFHGAWAHWYNSLTGEANHFSQKDNGGDIVETSFMFQGLLTARNYFNGNNAQEKLIREKITALWKEMDWNFYTQGQNVLYWHWSPDYDFAMNHPIKGYNEALITYILAAASPTYPIEKEVYTDGWARWDQEEFGNYSTYYGIMLPLGNKRYLGGPLFFAHYSYLGLDPRGLRDAYADYWQQNRRQSLINRAYCIDNPHGWKGYGPDFWGITACDMVPEGYMAHMPGYWFDRGTIAPTGAVSSIPYTPEESMAVIRNLYGNHGALTFGPLGFYDAVNFSVEGNPVRKSYLAIDQGPIIIMIENYRTGLLWKYFMQDPDVSSGLEKLGFTREKTDPTDNP